ncbi:hypothetical protein GBA52_009984 [Prunus armeniaca]|nr:hypothetical protein GBA52_009984 [Prunus armeniaca]
MHDIPWASLQNLPKHVLILDSNSKQVLSYPCDFCFSELLPSRLIEYENPNQARGFMHLRAEINTIKPFPASFCLSSVGSSKTWQNCSMNVSLIYVIIMEDWGTTTSSAHRRRRRRELRDIVPGREPGLSESSMNNPNQYRRRKVREGQRQRQTKEEPMDVDSACTK